MDITDIKRETKNGRIKFYLKNGNIMCTDVKTDEHVCVANNVESFISENKIISVEKEKLSAVIAIDDNGTTKYFLNLYCGKQGKFDGEIVLTEDISKARVYTPFGLIVDSQISSIQYSLKKNPSMSNPRIMYMIKQ